MSPEIQVHGIILAAGAARRMGENKLILSFKGKSLLQHAIDTALASNLHNLTLVLPAGFPEQLLTIPETCICTPCPIKKRKQLPSLKTGLNTVLQQAQGCMV